MGLRDWCKRFCGAVNNIASLELGGQSMLSPERFCRHFGNCIPYAVGRCAYPSEDVGKDGSVQWMSVPESQWWDYVEFCST